MLCDRWVTGENSLPSRNACNNTMDHIVIKSYKVGLTNSNCITEDNVQFQNYILNIFLGSTFFFYIKRYKVNILLYFYTSVLLFSTDVAKQFYRI